MLDIAIIGGGVTGLALARKLQQQGRDYCVFEARDRLGGRVLSVKSQTPEISIDLGASWYWPQVQPRMVKLVEELGLTSFPQSDDGTVWVLTDPNEKPKKLDNQLMHGGARRIAGGMSRLVEAMVDQLPDDRLVLSHELTDLSDRGDCVELVFRTPQGDIERTARQVVLAMPPRLIEENLLFSPPLPDEVQNALMGRPTWMAQQAKAVMVYDDGGDFRTQVGSANALVHHEQAVLSEVFDASDINGKTAALGGFLAMPSGIRSRFTDGMKMLVTSQLTQLFGPAFEAGRFFYQDWANQPLTCATQDLRDEGTDASEHPTDPRLQARLWEGKIWFAGSECASHQAGYLEGALTDADRVANRFAGVPSENQPALHSLRIFS